jgi:hypothetical protein
MGYCKYCDKEVVNLNIHEMGLKHMKLNHLYNYLDGLTDGREKDYIIKEIEKLKLVKNRVKVQKYKEYRKQYYEDNIKWKIRKVKPVEPMILQERKEIKGMNGNIEIQEIWKPNNKFINN